MIRRRKCNKSVIGLTGFVNELFNAMLFFRETLGRDLHPDGTVPTTTVPTTTSPTTTPTTTTYGTNQGGTTTDPSAAHHQPLDPTLDAANTDYQPLDYLTHKQIRADCQLPMDDDRWLFCAVYCCAVLIIKLYVVILIILVLEISNCN